MIVRTWRGSTRLEDGDEYLTYLRKTGLKEYRQTEGNMGVLALRRRVDNRCEFLLITFWKSADDVRRFSGPDMSRAVFYPDDERYLTDYDDFTNHYDVVELDLPVEK